VLSLIVACFGFFSSIVIFGEIAKIVNTLGYTSGTKYGILFAVGFTLIWLVTITTDSAQAIMLTGFKKAEKFKGETNE
tara:strand:+ start:453 stop:686 length:234 start_codon:yes stop_codon:yes gene_type:complete